MPQQVNKLSHSTIFVWVKWKINYYIISVCVQVFQLPRVRDGTTMTPCDVNLGHIRGSMNNTYNRGM